jgi:hypothetical protein
MVNYSVSPIINGLSDHDAQLITTLSYNLRPPTKKYRLIRNINDHTINDFLTKLRDLGYYILYRQHQYNVQLLSRHLFENVLFQLSIKKSSHQQKTIKIGLL